MRSLPATKARTGLGKGSGKTNTRRAETPRKNRTTRNVIIAWRRLISVASVVGGGTVKGEDMGKGGRVGLSFSYSFSLRKVVVGGECRRFLKTRTRTRMSGGGKD